MFMNPKISYPKIRRVSSGSVWVAQETEDLVNQDGYETTRSMKPEPHTGMRIIDKTKDQHKLDTILKLHRLLLVVHQPYSALLRHYTFLQFPCLVQHRLITKDCPVYYSVYYDGGYQGQFR